MVKRKQIAVLEPEEVLFLQGHIDTQAVSEAQVSVLLVDPGNYFDGRAEGYVEVTVPGAKLILSLWRLPTFIAALTEAENKATEWERRAFDARERRRHDR